jgi:hypothetical protein
VDPELAIDCVELVLHGARARAALPRDLGVGAAVTCETCHFPLRAREPDLAREAQLAGADPAPEGGEECGELRE